MTHIHRGGLALSLLTLALSAHAQSPAPTDPSYANQVQSLPNVQKPVKGQEGAKGFLVDDSLTLTTRNFFSRETSSDPVFSYEKNGARKRPHSRNT